MWYWSLFSSFYKNITLKKLKYISCLEKQGKRFKKIITAGRSSWWNTVQQGCFSARYKLESTPVYIFFSWSTALMGLNFLLVVVSRSNSDKRTWKDSSRQVIGPSQETSTWQQTTLTRDIHAPGGIRTCIPSKRTTAEPRHHWVWHIYYKTNISRSLSSGLLYHVCSKHFTLPKYWSEQDVTMFLPHRISETQAYHE